MRNESGDGMYCGKCGSRIDEDTGFCPRCDADKIVAMYLAEKEKSVKSRCSGTLKNKKRATMNACIHSLVLRIGILTETAITLMKNVGKAHGISVCGFRLGTTALFLQRTTKPLRLSH